MISGDALTDFNLEEIIGYHRAKAAMATLTLYRVPSPLAYGVVIVDREGARLADLTTEMTHADYPQDL